MSLLTTFGYFKYDPNITALTGGAATALDGLDASQYPELFIYMFVQTAVGLRIYQLKASALATSDMVITAKNKAGYQWLSVL